MDGAAGERLVPEDIICPCSSQVFRHRHDLLDIFYRHSQFLSHAIIIEGKVLFPQTQVTLADFGYPV